MATSDLRVRVGGLFETHLTVSDLGRAVAFYRDVVGLTIALEMPERGAAFFWIGGRGHAMLGLWSLGSAPVGLSLHIALEASLDDVLAACGRLRSLGVTPLSFFEEETTEPSVIGWSASSTRSRLSNRGTATIASQIRRSDGKPVLSLSYRRSLKSATWASAPRSSMSTTITLDGGVGSIIAGHRGWAHGTFGSPAGGAAHAASPRASGHARVTAGPPGGPRWWRRCRRTRRAARRRRATRG